MCFVRTLGNSLNLLRKIYSVDARADFFSVRIINVWNQLFDEIVNASVAISSFYYTLAKTDLSFGILGKHQYFIICCQHLLIFQLLWVQC